MWVTVDNSGKITGRFLNKQEGKNCIEVERSALDAVPYPKWNKTSKTIVNDDASPEAAYAYARARAAAYVKAFSKAPVPNPVDAIGHVLDAVLSHLAGDSTALNAIQTKRAEIKAANPKA